RQVARWLAALAVAPVLLDAYWLNIEHVIMPDLWFMALLVAALALLLWRPRPATAFVVAGGGGRRVLAVSASFTAAFLLPVLTYCTVSWAHDGHFRLSAGQSVNGR